MFFLWFCKNCMSGENLVVKLWPKMLSTNQIAVFFDFQCLWKERISLLDFFHGDQKSSFWDYYFWLSVTRCASRPVRLQDCLIINISERNWSISQIFLRGDNHQGKVASEISTFGWLCGHLCLLSNQIAGFFNRQYLWKESTDLLHFCIEIIIEER